MLERPLPPTAYSYLQPNGEYPAHCNANEPFVVEGNKYVQIVTPTNFHLELVDSIQKPTKFGILVQQAGLHAFVTTHACQSMGIGNVTTLHTNLATDEARRMPGDVFDPNDFLKAAHDHFQRAEAASPIAYYQESCQFDHDDDSKLRFVSGARGRALILGFDPDSMRSEERPYYHGRNEVGSTAAVIFSKRYLLD